MKHTPRRKKKRRGKRKRYCAHCGKDIFHTVSRLRANTSGLYYCSDKCAALSAEIAAKPNTKNPSIGRAAYRKRAFEIYDHECEICGYDEHIEVLEVHHRDGNRKNGADGNLQLLCPTCHKTLEYMKSKRIYDEKFLIYIY